MSKLQNEQNIHDPVPPFTLHENLFEINKTFVQNAGLELTENYGKYFITNKFNSSIKIEKSIFENTKIIDDPNSTFNKLLQIFRDNKLCDGYLYANCSSCLVLHFEKGSVTIYISENNYGNDDDIPDIIDETSAFKITKNNVNEEVQLQTKTYRVNFKTFLDDDYQRIDKILDFATPYTFSYVKENYRSIYKQITNDTTGSCRFEPYNGRQDWTIIGVPTYTNTWSSIKQLFDTNLAKVSLSDIDKISPDNSVIVVDYLKNVRATIQSEFAIMQRKLKDPDIKILNNNVNCVVLHE